MSSHQSQIFAIVFATAFALTIHVCYLLSSKSIVTHFANPFNLVTNSVTPWRKMNDFNGFDVKTWAELHGQQYQQNTTKYIILHGQAGGGSTFVSEFLRQNRNIFYVFEPLSLWNFHDWLLNAGKYLKGILICNISHLKNTHKGRNWLRYMLCHPTVLYWSLCTKFNVDMDLAAKLCKTKPIVATKTIRVEHLWYLERLVNEEGAKVIVLLRDPRGMMNSRSEENMSTTFDMAHHYCTNALNDIGYISSVIHSERAQQIIPNILLLRYEDVAKHPMHNLKEIYNFLGLMPDSHVVQWAQGVDERSRGVSRNFPKVEELALNTQRNNPADIPEKWRKSLSWDKAEVIQEACEPLMNLMGYKTAVSEEEVRNGAESYILPFSADTLFTMQFNEGTAVNT